MAASGHFGFWALLGLAHTFARGIGAQFFFKYLKVSESTLKPSSALGGHWRSKYDPTASSIPEPALKQLKASSFKTKGNTKDYFLIGETILIIGLLSVGLFCYTTSLTSTDKATTSGSKKAQLESTQPEAEAEAEAGVKRSAQLVETQSKEDNIFDM